MRTKILGALAILVLLTLKGGPARADDGYFVDLYRGSDADAHYKVKLETLSLPALRAELGFRMIESEGVCGISLLPVAAAALGETLPFVGRLPRLATDKPLPDPLDRHGGSNAIVGRFMGGAVATVLSSLDASYGILVNGHAEQPFALVRGAYWGTSAIAADKLSRGSLCQQTIDQARDALDQLVLRHHEHHVVSEIREAKRVDDWKQEDWKELAGRNILPAH